MRNLVAAGLVLSALSMPIAACDDVEPQRAIPRASDPPRSTGSPAAAVSPTPATTFLGDAPPDIKSVHWSDVKVPGEFCGVDGMVGPTGEGQFLTSRQYGRVEIYEDKEANYGDLDGDSKPEAAIGLECHNGNGNANGQIAFAYVVLTVTQGKLAYLGTVATAQNPPDVHVSFFKDIEMRPGQIVAHERWYRETDPTCCPSGNADTLWKLVDGRLVPGPPSITS